MKEQQPLEFGPHTCVVTRCNYCGDIGEFYPLISPMQEVMRDFARSMNMTLRGR